MKIDEGIEAGGGAKIAAQIAAETGPKLEAQGGAKLELPRSVDRASYVFIAAVFVLTTAMAAQTIC